ncbi:uncharacterized protein LOC115692906 [Syzygium oleosum]|uniref:uncharacterized protein LOC115692906 n=1 Tax=Syzygium oleosum TaxID=219896 RepID=UPI0011D2788F|nr:uncharacterized protein LOC115692906 [Syzygium oleosum]
MASARKILRRSIHTFLQNYHYFTSTSALLALPFSVSILLSQALVPASSPLALTIHSRLRALFDAAGFPPSSEFFALLNFKLSQTLSSSFLALPFALSFLLIAKSSVIRSLAGTTPSVPSSLSSFLSIYKPLLATYVCNCLVILSANSTAFFLLFFSFNCLGGAQPGSSNYTLLLSAAGAVLYSIILAHALVICNLALVLSGMERTGGFVAILKACALIRGSTSTSLSLAVPVNLALAGTEALFQFRVMRAYGVKNGPIFPVAMEGWFIAYLYSILIVLDTVLTCIFFKSCKKSSIIPRSEDQCYFRIKIGDFDNGDIKTPENLKSSESGQLLKSEF